MTEALNRKASAYDSHPSPAERFELVLDGLRQKVVARDDGDRYGGEVGLGAYHPQKLQSVGDRHAHIQDDGIRVYAIGELETRLCR